MAHAKYLSILSGTSKKKTDYTSSISQNYLMGDRKHTENKEIYPSFNKSEDSGFMKGQRNLSLITSHPTRLTRLQPISDWEKVIAFGFDVTVGCKRSQNKVFVIGPFFTDSNILKGSSGINGAFRISRKKIYVRIKGGISYIPWCIASYYIIKLQNARDPISWTGTRQLNNGGKRLVLPIKPSVLSKHTQKKPSVPLLCRPIYDFRFHYSNSISC